MRVLLDANVFISYLLHPERDSPNGLIVRSAIRGDFVLLLPEALLAEFVLKAGEKPYLAERIQAEDATEFASLLSEIAETIPKITRPIPAVTRDPKDDYLLAYAFVGEADYLVTGDNDLLVLRQIDNLKIINPRQFVELLGH